MGGLTIKIQKKTKQNKTGEHKELDGLYEPGEPMATDPSWLEMCHHYGEKVADRAKLVHGQQAGLPCRVCDDGKASKEKDGVVTSGMNWTWDKKINQEINVLRSWVFLQMSNWRHTGSTSGERLRA